MSFIKNYKSIFINSSGTIKALHSNLVDKLKSKAGNATVERASTIEFDNNLQTWVATINYDGKQFFSDIRSEVLEMEEKYINDLIRRGVI